MYACMCINMCICMCRMCRKSVKEITEDVQKREDNGQSDGREMDQKIRQGNR